VGWRAVCDTEAWRTRNEKIVHGSRSYDPHFHGREDPDESLDSNMKRNLEPSGRF
jgi:hypothetical protein